MLALIAASTHWSVTISAVIGGVLLGWSLSRYRKDGTRRRATDTNPRTNTQAIPQNARQLLARQQPLIEELGFDISGSPLAMATEGTWVQVYTHENGDAVAELRIATRGSTGLLTVRPACDVTFITCFDDGAWLYTTNAQRPDEERFSQSGAVFRCLPRLKPADLFYEHRMSIATYQETHQTAPAAPTTAWVESPEPAATVHS